MNRIIALVFVVVLSLPSLAKAQQGQAPPSGKEAPRSELGELLYAGGVGVVQGIGREAGSRFVSWLFPSTAEGEVSTTTFSQYLNVLLQKSKEHEKEIRELKGSLRERMTRAEVQELLFRSLKKIDTRLADQASKIQEINYTLLTHQRLFEQFEKDINNLSQKHKELFGSLETFRDQTSMEFQRQSKRITQTEEEMKALRRDYPRWEPNEQAEYLGAAGIEFLHKRDNREALKCFRFAHGYDPTDPCYLYLLAVASRRDGQKQDAELFLARAVAAERKRPLTYSRLWQNTVERFQGPDRLWIGDARHDPVYGVFVPGVIQIPNELLGMPAGTKK